MQCVTTPSAFASLVPVNLQTLKGRLFAFGGLIFCSLLLVFFIVVFAVSVGHADEDCHSHLVRWWSVSLSLYAFNLFLYAGFCFYVFKMQGGANPHYISYTFHFQQCIFNYSHAIFKGNDYLRNKI